MENFKEKVEEIIKGAAAKHKDGGIWVPYPSFLDCIEQIVTLYSNDLKEQIKNISDEINKNQKG